ncbi:cysteine hydrolase family protein [Cognatishimia sp.]|uniref:cysteine hydrolase family protein n=1 Tax=Cognatishimia sp. TaxID=2211648 RepID=UPI003515150A
MSTALLLIDIQMGFQNPVWGARNNPAAEDNAADLLAAWRTQDWPVCHVRHVSVEPNSPLGPDTGGTEFMAQVAPTSDEPIFEKSVNSAFIGTSLESHLRQLSVTDLVVCGLTTPHCVSTSSRMAANLGFQVTLAHDACAAFEANANAGWSDTAPQMTAQQIHDSAVSHLHGEFVTARRTAQILADLS